MSDLISRQAAIDAMQKAVKNIDSMNKADIVAVVSNLPSIQPDRKKGMWLFPYGDKKYKRCSVCERDYYSIPHNSNFCPNCGADMRGET